MAIAGALAGLAGVSYYCGYCTAIRIGVQPSHGFDGVAVALLGGISPVGVVFASIFFAILQTGKGFMSVMTKIAPNCRHHHCHHHLFCGHQQVCRPVLRPVLGLVS